MPKPIQGQDILFLVKLPDGTYSPLGYQRNATRQSQTPTIDISGKQSHAAEFVPGRNSDQLTVESLYVPGQIEWQTLVAAQRDRQSILVQWQELGVAVEQAEGVITNLQMTAQDQQAVTCSATVQISGGWETLVAH